MNRLIPQNERLIPPCEYTDFRCLRADSLVWIDWFPGVCGPIPRCVRADSPVCVYRFPGVYGLTPRPWWCIWEFPRIYGPIPLCVQAHTAVCMDCFTGVSGRVLRCVVGYPQVNVGWYSAVWVAESPVYVGWFPLCGQIFWRVWADYLFVFGIVPWCAHRLILSLQWTVCGPLLRGMWGDFFLVSVG